MGIGQSLGGLPGIAAVAEDHVQVFQPGHLQDRRDVAEGLADVQVLQSGAVNQRGVVPDAAVVQLQPDQILAGADGLDVLHLRPGENQVLELGHVGDKIDGVHGHVT